ncbi:MAG: hypothetical protein ABIH04_07630 [Planctomycetota bacterium]
MNNSEIHNEDMAAALAAAITLEGAGKPAPMLKFSCRCGKHIVAPVAAAGRKGYCPKCKNGLTVPRWGAANILAIRCSCGKDISPGLLPEGRGRCPACSREIAIASPLMRTTSPLLLSLLVAIPVILVVLVIYILVS